MPVDIVGNEIKVGDTVVFGMAQTMNQQIGKVAKICEKSVKIEWVLRRMCFDFSTRKEMPVFIPCINYRTFDNVVVVTAHL